jgi:hypothetical protein
MFNIKNALILTAISVLLQGTPAIAQDNTDTEGALTLGGSETLTLGDLRDLGLCINQLQQQSKNIFLEVTRKPVPRTAQPHYEDLKEITKGSVDATARYLPVRPEWITYYVGTMEPMIQLFRANLEATRSGASKLMVPKSTVDEFATMLSNYDLAVNAMNKNLDVIYSKLSDPHANVAIAQETVKLYEVTQAMEKARHRAFNLVKQADRRHEERSPVAPVTSPTPSAAPAP